MVFKKFVVFKSDQFEVFDCPKCKILIYLISTKENLSYHGEKAKAAKRLYHESRLRRLADPIYKRKEKFMSWLGRDSNQFRNV